MTGYYAYNIVPSESIKLMTIIFRKMRQTEEGQNMQLLIKLFALSVLGSNNDLHVLQSY